MNSENKETHRVKSDFSLYNKVLLNLKAEIFSQPETLTFYYIINFVKIKDCL